MNHDREAMTSASSQQKSSGPQGSRRWSLKGFRCGCHNDDPSLVRPWQTWRWVHKFESWLYGLGVISGACFGSHGDAGVPMHLCGLYWDGARPYRFFLSRDQWRCLLRYHHVFHSLTGDDFGMCGKCCPWPCCGSIEYDHDPTCAEYVAPPTYPPSIRDWSIRPFSDYHDQAVAQ